MASDCIHGREGWQVSNALPMATERGGLEARAEGLQCLPPRHKDRRGARPLAAVANAKESKDGPRDCREHPPPEQEHDQPAREVGASEAVGQERVDSA
jgi:hypothetical protein